MKKTDNINLDYEVDRLNRFFKLYTQSIKDKRVKPYRVSKLRGYLETLLTIVKNKYEVVTVDQSNFGDYFADLKEQLNSTREDKIKAIKRKDYEDVATSRDKEKKLIRDYLIKSGFPTNVYFFHHDNRIFKA